jgi:hypothetical protein
MPRNKVQFQKGLSDAEFEALYGTEERCRAALFILELASLGSAVAMQRDGEAPAPVHFSSPRKAPRRRRQAGLAPRYLKLVVSGGGHRPCDARAG